MVQHPSGVQSRLPLDTGGLAKFTAAVALLAIFFDASLGHALAWENDPYWTYWITKTFLIATIFGLGTAWFGVGLGRGAIITAVHTLVLTIYYWTFSPIGLPSSPEWLDLEHTWISGLPIHFAVIYLGYVVALWLFQRPKTDPIEKAGQRSLGTSALLSGVAIVVVAGLVSSLALGAFPGFTWFLVRLLITIPFLLFWWGVAGNDRISRVTGALVLALIWVTYGHFLGPIGLPDSPLRILDSNPPPATVEFLDYGQLWLISFPIYLVVMAVVMAIGGPRTSVYPRPRAVVSLMAVLPLLLVTGASPGTSGQQGANASLEASGPVQIMDVQSGEMTEGSGQLSISALDMGGRVSPLPPNDQLSIDATIETADGALQVTVRQPMVEHPLGSHTTWWGVGLGVTHHGQSGIGTASLPYVTSEFAAFGLGSVAVDGTVAATNVPVHVMTASEGLPGGARMALDIVPEGFEPSPGIPGGQLMILWANYEAQIDQPHGVRYAIGGAITVALLVGAIHLVRREERALR